jgi:hypothetical protein
MKLSRNVLRGMISAWHGSSAAVAPRRSRQVELSWECLEGRTVPSHLGAGLQHSFAGLGGGFHQGTSSSGSTQNSQLSTARQTLQNDIQTIELASGTTVGELTAIRVAFQTLANDGLSPSSASAFKSFENALVTAYASGTTLTGNSTLLSQFEALYTSSPTTQQTTDLTTAYNALAAAVTSSNITSANISTIDTDWAAVLAAEGSTSTATFPYFTLVTGRVVGGGCY